VVQNNWQTTSSVSVFFGMSQRTVCDDQGARSCVNFIIFTLNSLPPLIYSGFPNFVRQCCSGIRDSLSQLDVILSRSISLSPSHSHSPHTAIYVCDSVLILLYMCPHTAIYVSSYCYICVLILLYMCPHTAIHSYIRKPWWKDDGKKGEGVMGG
jgi:hypothetical protein